MSAPATGNDHDPTQLRYLTPDQCHIHLGAYNTLHVTVVNERIYGGIYAALLFPVSHPDDYIALIQAGHEDRNEQEIGVIRRLADFPEPQAELIRQALRRRYFVHVITGIRRIRWEYGLISFDVDTDKGPTGFLMHWQGDKAVDYDHNGKILLDVYDNRYLIPDLDTLSPRERTEFKRFIYW